MKLISTQHRVHFVGEPVSGADRRIGSTGAQHRSREESSDREPCYREQSCKCRRQARIQGGHRGRAPFPWAGAN